MVFKFPQKHRFSAQIIIYSAQKRKTLKYATKTCPSIVKVHLKCCKFGVEWPSIAFVFSSKRRIYYSRGSIFCSKGHICCSKHYLLLLKTSYFLLKMLIYLINMLWCLLKTSHVVLKQNIQQLKRTISYKIHELLNMYVSTPFNNDEIQVTATMTVNRLKVVYTGTVLFVQFCCINEPSLSMQNTSKANAPNTCRS